MALGGEKLARGLNGAIFFCAVYLRSRSTDKAKCVKTIKMSPVEIKIVPVKPNVVLTIIHTFP